MRRRIYVLLNILEDLVTDDTLKVGTSTMIKNDLLDKIFNSGLKYCPHVESKIKNFKTKYVVIYDVLQRSGFRWSDVSEKARRGLEVDNDEEKRA